MSTYVKKTNSEVLVARIPKSGVQSIHAAMQTFEAVELPESEAYSIRLGFIRDPIDRFMSAYSFFHWLKELSPRQDIPPTDTYEGFVDHALETENQHWQPYTEMFPNMNHVYRLTEINEVWPKYFGPGLLPGHHNMVVRLSGNEYRKGEIEDFYAEDFALWRSL